MRKSKKTLMLLIAVAISVAAGFMTITLPMLAGGKTKSTAIPKPGPAPLTLPVSPSGASAPISAPASPRTDIVLPARDVFKEFFEKTSKQSTVRHMHSNSGNQIPQFGPVLTAVVGPSPVSQFAPEGSKTPAKINGIICRGGDCIIMTEAGELKNGDKLNDEIIIAIKRNEITTNRKTIVF